MVTQKITLNNPEKYASVPTISREKLIKAAEKATDKLEELSKKYGLTVHLATHYEGEVVYIEKYDEPEFIIIYSQVGKRAPMTCTGVGKAMLAYLGEEYIRKYILTKPFIVLVTMAALHRLNIATVFLIKIVCENISNVVNFKKLCAPLIPPCYSYDFRMMFKSCLPLIIPEFTTVTAMCCMI